MNLYYVLRWTLNRIDTLGLALLDDTEEQLYERCFEPLGVKPYQYLKLLGNAEWVEPDERVALTIEGEPVRRLFVSIDGDFDDTVEDRLRSMDPPYSFEDVQGCQGLVASAKAQSGVHEATTRAETGSPSHSRAPDLRLLALNQG